MLMPDLSARARVRALAARLSLPEADAELYLAASREAGVEPTAGGLARWAAVRDRLDDQSPAKLFERRMREVLASFDRLGQTTAQAVASMQQVSVGLDALDRAFRGAGDGRRG